MRHRIVVTVRWRFVDLTREEFVSLPGELDNSVELQLHLVRLENKVLRDVFDVFKEEMVQ